MPLSQKDFLSGDFQSEDFPLPARVPVSGKRPVEPNAENFPHLTPAEKAADEAWDRTPENLEELDRAIAAQKKPNLRAILEAEKTRIVGERGGIKKASFDTMSQDQFLGRAVAPKEADAFDRSLKITPGEFFLNIAKDAGRAAIGGLAGLTDMFAGLGGMAMSAGAYAGTRAYAAGAGETNAMGAQAAAHAAQTLTPDALAAPFRKIMESLGYADVYDHSAIAQGMELISKGIEKGGNYLTKKTDGAVQPEDVGALANAAMLYFGTKGTSAAVRAAAEKGSGFAKAMSTPTKVDLKEFLRPIDDAMKGDGPLAGTLAPVAPKYAVEPTFDVPATQERLTQQHPEVESDLLEHPSGAVEIRDFGLKDLGNQGNKLAYEAMQDVVKRADDTGTELIVLAQPNRGSKMPLSKLEAWYEKHGFVKGEEQPYEDSTYMYREPKGNELENANRQEGAERGASEAPREEESQTVAGETGSQRLGQRGSVDPKLVGGLVLGGVGALAGAALMPNSKVKGALIGGLAAFGLTQLRAGKGLDYYLGNISTRLGNISPALKLRARDMERNILKKTDAALSQAQPFLKAKDKLPAAVKEQLDLALLENDPAKISRLIQGNRPLVDGWKKVQTLLHDFETQLTGLGRFKQGLADYFPRVVKDLDGLKKAISSPMRTSLEKTLAEAEAKVVKTQQRGLTDIEKSIIINNSLAAGPQGSPLPGHAQTRRIQQMTAALAQFYDTPTNSLLRYVRAATEDIEGAKFFGKDLVHAKRAGGRLATNVDASIGNIVEKELKAGRMTHDQADTLRGILKSRFEGGGQAMSGPLQDVRNLSNIGLLGSYHAAATQIGDSVMTLYHHGLAPTLEAVGRSVTRNSQYTPRDFGLINHIAEELGSQRFTGRALQTVFKLNLFSAIDQFAKGLNLNAGLAKNQRLARTAKGSAELAKKYQVAFGNEFLALLDDLRNGRKSDRVESLLFSELSDAQPISKMEMPQAYLEHPNGRLLFQMKTYMLKQMDIIRRDAIDEFRAGNKVKAFKNLLAVSAALSLSNVPGDIVKDWLSGRPVDLKNIKWVENLLQNFGLNRYATGQIGQGKGLEVARDMVVPPFKHYQEIAEGGAKAVKYIPGPGRAIYDRKLGGNEARARGEEMDRKRRNPTDDEILRKEHRQDLKLQRTVGTRG